MYGSGSWALRFETYIRVYVDWGLGLKVSGFGFWAWGSGFWVRVWGFRLGAWGLGLEGLGLEFERTLVEGA